MKSETTACPECGSNELHLTWPAWVRQHIVGTFLMNAGERTLNLDTYSTEDVEEMDPAQPGVISEIVCEECGWTNDDPESQDTLNRLVQRGGTE